MSIQPIDPSYMTVKQWADFMVPVLEPFGNLGRLDRDEHWRDWAAQLLTLPKLSGSIVPDPYQFEDWRTWAVRACAGLSQVS